MCINLNKEQKDRKQKQPEAVNDTKCIVRVQNDVIWTQPLEKRRVTSRDVEPYGRSSRLFATIRQ